MVVPSTAPSWTEVLCSPPATPASSSGALPTIASELAVSTRPMPAPSRANAGQIAP